MSTRGRILVIDDEAHIVAVLSLKLRNAGYEVLTAVDGEEGLAIVQEALGSRPSAVAAATADSRPLTAASSIDLIITDFHMPYMTGLELCKALSADAATAKIPVLLLTARGYALDPEDLMIGSAGGPPMIRDVLSKPFSPRAIVDKIQSLLGETVRDNSAATGSAPTATTNKRAGPGREAA